MTRFFIFRSIIFLGLIALGVGLFHTQVLKGDYYHRLSEQNHVRLVPLEAPRGRVMDRAGRLLAANRPSYDVVVTPEDMTSEAYPILAKLLSLPEKELRYRMTSPREYPFAPALIAQDISREMAFRIEELRPELPGVSIRVSGVRYYPYRETAANLIGYIGKINPLEYQSKDHDRYGLTSLMGRAGIEKAFDERLRGWRGGRQIEVDSRGQFIRIISERVPEPGEDIKLTLDLEFQKRIMEMIKDKHASVAILDLTTDGFLALASTPSYDPNIFSSPAFSKERLEILKSPEAPLLDRGMGAAYPPGSVFKLVTALAALETGKITPNTRFNCTGAFQLNAGSRVFHCWDKEGHGSMNLYEALERSCNVYFYNLGKRLSADELAHYARELGLGEPMKLEVANVAPGLVPDAAWKKQRLHDEWYQGETLSFAIGQGYLLVSPLQILRLVAIIAKDGRKVTPHLVQGAEDDSQASKVAIHQQNLEVIKRGMLRVVQSDYGTGQLARVKFEKLAAKTGTAQAPPKEAHSWLTGFFPYKNPQIAIVIFVEHGGPGGITAGKLAKNILEIWKEMNLASVV